MTTHVRSCIFIQHVVYDPFQSLHSLIYGHFESTVAIRGWLPVTFVCVHLRENKGTIIRCIHQTMFDCIHWTRSTCKHTCRGNRR